MRDGALPLPCAFSSHRSVSRRCFTQARGHLSQEVDGVAAKALVSARVIVGVASRLDPE